MLVLVKIFVCWMTLIFGGTAYLCEAAYTKCSHANECETVLSTDDQQNESIRAFCTQQKVAGTCVVQYWRLTTLGIDVAMKDPIGPGCTKLPKNSTITERCEMAKSELKDQFPPFDFRFGDAYSCKTQTGTKRTYFTCSVRTTLGKETTAALGGEANLMDSKAKSGCQMARNCDKILPMAEQMKVGIYKFCFTTDRNCTSKCDRACGFVYSTVEPFQEKARKPNPEICVRPTDAETEMFNTICKDRFVQVMNIISPKHKHIPYTPPGFMCTVGTTKYIACVNQAKM